MSQLFVLERRFYRLLATLAVPIILQGLINFGVNMADTVMLGMLGEVSLSASALANQFCFLFLIINFGLAGGAGVLTGQFWGKGDHVSIGKTMSIVYRFTIVFACVFTAAAQLFPKQILSLYTNETAVIEQGAVYLRIISLAYLVQGLSTISALVLRTVGVVRLTLLTSIVTLCNNVALNWVLIFGNLGAPQMGVAGAALATAIARYLEFIVIAVYMLVIDKKIRFRPRMILSTDKTILKDYIKNGFPVLISDIILAVGTNVVTAVLGRMGSNVVAANSINSVVWQLTTMFQMGISGSSAVIIGNAVGAKKYDDTQRYGITLLCLSFIVGILSGTALFFLKDFAVGFFNVTDETKQIAFQIMTTIAIITPFGCCSGLLTKGVLRAGGDTRFLMLADVLFLWIVSIPLGYYTGLVLKLPPGIVVFFLKIDDIMKAVWCTFRLISRKWIKNVTLSVPEPESIKYAIPEIEGNKPLDSRSDGC